MSTDTGQSVGIDISEDFLDVRVHGLKALETKGFVNHNPLRTTLFEGRRLGNPLVFSHPGP
jgi:hypothetical protein